MRSSAISASGARQHAGPRGVHPRRCGAGRQVKTSALTTIGSSPRARGGRPGLSRTSASRRFIPGARGADDGGADSSPGPLAHYDAVERRRPPHQPSLAPGRYFRLLLVSYFEGLDSERAIANSCRSSRSHIPWNPSPASLPRWPLPTLQGLADRRASCSSCGSPTGLAGSASRPRVRLLSGAPHPLPRQSEAVRIFPMNMGCARPHVSEPFRAGFALSHAACGRARGRTIRYQVDGGRRPGVFGVGAAAANSRAARLPVIMLAVTNRSRHIGVGRRRDRRGDRAGLRRVRGGAAGSASSIGEGRVTLVTSGAPLGDVLAAWERAGSTRFVDAGELDQVPVSLHLVDVPEAEALRLLLRPAAGYLAVPRARPPRVHRRSATTHFVTSRVGTTRTRSATMRSAISPRVASITGMAARACSTGTGAMFEATTASWSSTVRDLRRAGAMNAGPRRVFADRLAAMLLPPVEAG